MELEKALADLQNELNFTYQQEGNQYRVFIDEDSSLWVKGQLAGIRLWSDLIALPNENCLAVLKLIMRANLFGQGTGKGLISLDQVSKYFVYSIDHPWLVNYKIFKDLIEEVCNFTEYWKQAIEQEKEGGKLWGQS